MITASSHPQRLRRLVDMLLCAYFKRKEYDIAHVDVFSGFAVVYAELVSRIFHVLRKPFILTIHGGSFPSVANKRPELVHRLLNRANKVITPSRYLQDELKRFQLDIIYIPNGLDLSLYPFQLRANPRARMCWLRAFHEIYNPILAVEVVADVRKYIPDIHLTMIGPDKADGSLVIVNKMLKENELGTFVEITGPVPKTDVPLWLQKHDIFINTTRYESFGVAVMEAAALGLPVVTTNVGELPYLWNDGEDALLVPSEDAGAMAEAVKRLLSEPGLAERLSCNARAKAEKYDWSAILPQWESVIREVLDRA